MSHARQQIRDAVVTALTGSTAAGANVFATRIHKFEQQALPAISVYTLSEDAERETMSPRKQSRTLRVAIDVAAQQVSGIDAALDDIAVEIEEAIEAAIVAASGIWGTVRNVEMNSTTIITSGEGEQRAIGMVMTYSFNYRVLEGAPETIIP